jgi:hypothetical protein
MLDGGRSAGAFSRASSLADSFRLIPTKARLVESCDGTLRFHHSSIRSVG